MGTPGGALITYACIVRYLLPHVCVQVEYDPIDWTYYTDLDLWADYYAYGSWTVQYMHPVFP